MHCHYYGVKGKIDSTILCTNNDKKEQVTALELKTGKHKSFCHRGQVLLYNLLLKNLFKNASEDGFLLYLMLDSEP